MHPCHHFPINLHHNHCCRAAEDAAHARDGYDFYGTTLRVEIARGGNPRGPPRGPTNRRPGTFRVTIRGLPPSASWQDLKVRFGAAPHHAPALPHTVR